MAALAGAALVTRGDRRDRRRPRTRLVRDARVGVRPRRVPGGRRRPRPAAGARGDRSAATGTGVVHRCPRARSRPPAYDPDEIAGVVPVDYRKPYDVREVVARLVDASDFTEFKPRYGSATVCLQARHLRPCLRPGRQQRPDRSGRRDQGDAVHSAVRPGRPAAGVPATTPRAIMVGTKSERAGMIKHGSKMIQAVSNVRVPRIALYIGASFGAGNYAMCGSATRSGFPLRLAQRVDRRDGRRAGGRHHGLRSRAEAARRGRGARRGGSWRNRRPSWRHLRPPVQRLLYLGPLPGRRHDRPARHAQRTGFLAGHHVGSPAPHGAAEQLRRCAHVIRLQETST